MGGGGEGEGRGIQCCQEGARGGSQVPWVCKKAGIRCTCKRWDSGTEADLPFPFLCGSGFSNPKSKFFTLSWIWVFVLACKTGTGTKGRRVGFPGKFCQLSCVIVVVEKDVTHFRIKRCNP